jgi:hypothetical protein
MSIDSITASGVFRVGDVMSRAWRLFAGNLPFFPLAPVVIYLIMVVVFAVFVMTAGLAGWTGGSPIFIWLGGGLGVIATLSFTLIGQGLLLLGAFQRLRGQPLRVGQVLHRVFARLGPLLGLSILWGLGLSLAVFFSAMLFGMLGLLIGPFALVLAPAIYALSVYLLIVWAVIVPACLVEGLGPLDSMIRSFDLTKGYRWKVFGIMFLLVLLSIVAVIAQVTLTAYGQTAASIFAIVWLLPWIAYWNCNIIMIYHDLRVAKEGVDTEQIAAIFD